MLEPEAVAASVMVLSAVKPKATAELIQEAERQATLHKESGHAIVHHYKHTSTKTEEEDYSTRHEEDRDEQHVALEQTHRRRWWQLSCMQ